MNFQKFAFTLLLLAGISFISCKKDETEPTPPDPNKDVADKLPGIWVSSKVVQNGIDITAQTSGSMTFGSDKSLSFGGVESGMSFDYSGTWEVKEAGTVLDLFITGAGHNDYKINSFSSTKMVLEAIFGPSTRVFDFQKQ